MAKTAGVREFRTKLSQYLREVEHGETVLVTDRGRVIAQVTPPGKVAEPELSRDDRVRHQLLADGLVSHLGTQDEGDWPEPKNRGVRRGDARTALDADREDRV